MRFVLEPSLQHMALVKIVVSLWNQNDVRALILNLRSSLDLNSLFNPLDIYITEEWDKIEERVTRKVLKLLIPQLLKEKTLSLIKPIGIQLSKWLSFHWKFHLCQNLPAEFCWTPQGIVDGKRTAEVLVKDENLDLSERYKLACVHCLENDVLEIWNNMHEDLQASFLHCNIYLVVSWTRAMMSNGHYSYRKNFYFSTDDGNKAAVEYFLQKLTPGEKENVLVKVAKRAVDNDVLFFLLSKMDHEQQIEVFQDRPYQILLIFLQWPLQSYFIKIANSVWHLLSEEDFASFLKRIDLKGYERYKDWDYQKLFREFWQNSPYAYKSFITRKLHKSLFLEHLFLSDKESLRLILKDALPTAKKKLIYNEKNNNFCRKCIWDNNWDFLEFYIGECLPSKEEKLQFKEEFQNFFFPNSDNWKELIENRILPYSHRWKKEEFDEIMLPYIAHQKTVQKWNQLFCLSDDSVSKHDKRSIEEGESSSSKRFHSLQCSKQASTNGISIGVQKSDYSLFRSMQHFFKGRRFESFNEVEEACQEFFDSKEPPWYFQQIQNLAERWQKVVDYDGLYFEE